MKAAGYEPGDRTVPESDWNAVYGECGWQIVHPFWICRALFGHNLGGWVKVEAGGETMISRQKFSAGVVLNTFQDRYFMPKPDEFLYECCALDTDWQLVKKERTVKSKDEFLIKPYLLPPFHGLGLTLVSEQNCKLESQNGMCRIEFKGKHSNSHFLILTYELFKKESQVDGSKKKQKMSRMVFNSRSNDHFIFDIRFPEEGEYKLVIFGSPYKSPALRICEFKIDCRKRLEGCKLLPLDGSKLGWGPGPATLEVGLLIPSKPNGLVTVDKNDKNLKSEIKFRIRDDFVNKHEVRMQVKSITFLCKSMKCYPCLPDVCFCTIY